MCFPAYTITCWFLSNLNSFFNTFVRIQVLLCLGVALIFKDDKISMLCNNDYTFIVPWYGRPLHKAVSASSQCHWDELNAIKVWELMLLKCQMNTNTKKMEFCFLQNVKGYWNIHIFYLFKIFYLCLQIFKVKFVSFTTILDQ